MTRTFAEQNDSTYSAGNHFGGPMIDLKTLEIELHQCRLARLDAEAAERDVEDMIWQV
jgi:hypothetical protein